MFRECSQHHQIQIVPNIRNKKNFKSNLRIEKEEKDEENVKTEINSQK